MIIIHQHPRTILFSLRGVGHAGHHVIVFGGHFVVLGDVYNRVHQRESRQLLEYAALDVHIIPKCPNPFFPVERTPHTPKHRPVIGFDPDGDRRAHRVEIIAAFEGADILLFYKHAAALSALLELAV